MPQYVGNIHIHSYYSDGHATIDEIARAAARAGLDFIIISDHNTLKGLPEEGLRHGVLTIVGCEINCAKNHYLALNISEPVPPNDEHPQQVIDAVNAQGGFGFILHPSEKGSPLVNNYQRFPWTDFSVKGFTGIEVMNWCSQWRDAITGVIPALYYGYLAPTAPVKGPERDALAFFDRVTQKQKAVLFGGDDAHCWYIKRGPIRRTIFPYEYQFGLMSNVVTTDEPLSSDFHTAKRQILAAIKRGRLFIVQRHLGSHEGFSFSAVSNDREYQAGDEVPLGPLTFLRVNCPAHKARKAKIRILRNGKPLDEVLRCNVSVRITEPGTYRLEILLGDKTWIITNPVYVKE